MCGPVSDHFNAQVLRDLIEAIKNYDLLLVEAILNYVKEVSVRPWCLTII